MIYIGLYDEFSPNKGLPSMKVDFEEKPYEGQNQIINYLSNGTVDMCRDESLVDVISGDKIKMPMLGMNDGEYSWWNVLAYYVKKYNLRLPKDFEDKILNQN